MNIQSMYPNSMFSKRRPNISADIPEHTQCSINVQKIEDLTNLTKSSGTFSNDRTAFHQQKRSNLCHSFSIVSCFRNCLLKFLKSLQNIDQEKLSKIEEELKKSDGIYSFRSFLVNFVANVNPRSYEGLVNPAGADPFEIEKQTAVVELVVNRLVNPTMFEIAGWKRLFAGREIFEKLGLQIDNYQMTQKTVKSAQFQVKFIKKSKIQTTTLDKCSVRLYNNFWPE